MALIYKGEAIAVGTGKSIIETLKNIFTWAKTIIASNGSINSS